MLVESKDADAAMNFVKDLTYLRMLRLDNTQMTDAGLAHLQWLTALQELFHDKTQVTDAGVSDLQQALPDCYIDR